MSDGPLCVKGCAEGYARDATEIQNIQIAEGDVCHSLPIPIYMVFPRLFTCPTLETTNFKVGQLFTAKIIQRITSLRGNMPLWIWSWHLSVQKTKHRSLC